MGECFKQHQKVQIKVSHCNAFINVPAFTNNMVIASLSDIFEIPFLPFCSNI